MADSKLTALSEPATIAGTDVLYGVSDPEGTPTSAKFEVGRLMGPLTETSYSVDTTLAFSSGAKFSLTGNTARTFTVPSVGSDEDRGILYLKNRSSTINLTVALSDSDTFDFPGLSVSSITLEPGAEVCIQYIHSSTRFDFLSVVGVVCAAGTELYIKSGKEVGSSFIPHEDELGNLYYGKGTQFSYDTATVAYGSRAAPYITSLSGSEILCPNELYDFDIFNDQTNDATISLWMWDAGLAANKDILSVAKSNENSYYLYLDASRYLTFKMIDSLGNTWINITTTTTSTAAWHHLAICKVAGAVGMYLDGTQIGYDGSFSSKSVTQDLVLGDGGLPNATNMLGLIDDFAVVRSNIFGAAPDAGLTDSFTVTANSYLNLRK